MTKSSDSRKLRKMAEKYIKAGYTVIPLSPRSKTPVKGWKWTERCLTENGLNDNLPTDANIGIVLGDKSNGLVDIDFDHPAASLLGNIVFEELPAFGRKSVGISHRLARCPKPGKTVQFELTEQEAVVLGLKAGEKTTIIEVRGNGGYTMAPPSTHPCGDILAWSGDLPDDFPNVEYDEVKQKAGLVAFLTVIYLRYPTTSGSRDNVCLALTGTLLRAGCSPEYVDKLVSYVADHKGDEEANARTKATGTKNRLDSGADVTGLPSLCELLGIQELEPKLRKWLGLASTSNPIPQEILRMNERFFVVGDEGGKCLVMYFEEQSMGKGQKRLILKSQSIGDFKNRFAHQRILAGTDKAGNPIMKPLGKAWFEHPERRQFDRVDFRPAEETPSKVLNLWRGFSVQANPGNWSRLRRHIFEVFANRNSEHFRYILRWMAWAVQNPGLPSEVALVVRGGKGTGKGTLFRLLVELFGQHGLHVFTPSAVTGRFNGHLRCISLLFADEAITADNKQAESALKGMITEPMLPIEQKGKDIIQAQNHLKIAMASNDDWIVPASEDERRYAVFDAASTHANDGDWFRGIYDEMFNGGKEAFLYFLQNLNLGRWHPRDDVPRNAALQSQQMMSLKPLERVYLDCLLTGELMFQEDDEIGSHYRGQPRIITRRLVEFVNRTSQPTLKVTDCAAGRFLDDMGCRQDRSQRPSGWVTTELSEARRKWDQRRFEIDWPEEPSAWFSTNDVEVPF